MSEVKTADMPAPGPEYLGDGAYARFDGYSIVLSANDHKNEVITLEPEVLLSLIRYAKRCGMMT